MERLTVLGATGTVGRSTLDVAARHADRYRVHGLSANRDVAGMLELCRQYRPAVAVMADEAAAAGLSGALEAGDATRVLGGAEALCALGADPDADVVMTAIVGAAGLMPTLAAVEAGHRVLVANKEPLVMAGELMMRAAQASGAVLLPIDSEHNGVFQCLSPDYRCGQRPASVRRVVLTASGGPFRGWSADQLEHATPEQALKHPNWEMGPKITIDSATMMNKALELIEASWLFALRSDELDVVVHPQSLVHALVEFDDGSTLAHLGRPDMRVPIAHGLAWPQRHASGVSGLSLIEAGRLDFEAPDDAAFPAIGLARRAMRLGGLAAAVMNAANEVAVQAFLDGRIGFRRIVDLAAEALDALRDEHGAAAESIEQVLSADAWARERTGASLEAAHA